MGDAIKRTIGANIKRLRTERNISTRELGDQIGVASSTVSDWETAKKMPRAGAIERLADYFGVLKTEILEDKPYREIAKGQFMPSLIDIDDLLLNGGIRIVHNEQFISPEKRELLVRVIDAILYED